MEKRILVTKALFTHGHNKFELEYYSLEGEHYINLTHVDSRVKIDFKKDDQQWYCSNPRSGILFRLANEVLDDLLEKLSMSEDTFLRKTLKMSLN